MRPQTRLLVPYSLRRPSRAKYVSVNYLKCSDVEASVNHDVSFMRIRPRRVSIPAILQSFTQQSR